MRRCLFPSVLSKHYDTLSSDEASAAAHQIEGEAFSAAGASAATSADGIETLHGGLRAGDAVVLCVVAGWWRNGWWSGGWWRSWCMKMALVLIYSKQKSPSMAPVLCNRDQRFLLLVSSQYVSGLKPRQNDENDRGQKPFLHW